MTIAEFGFQRSLRFHFPACTSCKSSQNVSRFLCAVPYPHVVSRKQRDMWTQGVSSYCLRSGGIRGFVLISRLSDSWRHCLPFAAWRLPCSLCFYLLNIGTYILCYVNKATLQATTCLCCQGSCPRSPAHSCCASGWNSVRTLSAFLATCAEKHHRPRGH